MEATPGVALLVGAGTLVGGILLGKAVVDLAQGQLADTSGPSPMDESVRFVGSMIGLSLAVIQLPKAYEAAQAIIAGESPVLP